MENNNLSDQLANLSPVWIVVAVMIFTLVRLTLAKNKEGWAKAISETCDTVNFVLILAFLLIRPFVAQAFFIPSESMENTLLVHDRLIVNKFSYRLSEPKRGDVVVFEAPPEASEEQREGIDFIKRLIALPKDTIQVKAAKMTVNGIAVEPNQQGIENIHEYLRSKLGIERDKAIKIFPDYVLVDSKERVSKEQLAEMLSRPGAKITLTPGQTILNGKVLDEPYTREDPDYDFPSANGGPLTLGENELFMMGDNRNRSRDSHAWGALERRRVVGRASLIFWPPARIGAIR